MKREIYKKLKTKDSPSVKYKTLPEDVTIEGWKFDNEFAKKTAHLLKNGCCILTT